MLDVGRLLVPGGGVETAMKIRGLVIIFTVILTGHSASARPPDDNCLRKVVSVTVVDMFGGPVTHGTVELLRTAANVDAKSVPMLAVTDEAGICEFRNVECGEITVTSTTPGFPRLQVQVTITDTPATTTVKLDMRNPCPSVADLTLTDDDRVAILKDLLAHATSRSDVAVVVDSNLGPLRKARAEPAGLEVLTEGQLFQRSRASKVQVVHVQPIAVRGSCVVAGYRLTCVEDGRWCNLCCSEAAFTYRQTDGQWRATFYWGGEN